MNNSKSTPCCPSSPCALSSWRKKLHVVLEKVGDSCVDPGCNVLVHLKDTRGNNVVDGRDSVGKNLQVRHPGRNHFKLKNVF